MANRKNKNRITSMIPAIVVIFLVIGGLIVMTMPNTLDATWGDTTEAGTAVTGTVTGYKNGIPVSSAILGSFYSDGLEITDFEIKVVWFSSGVSIDWSTFVLSGSTSVSCEFADGSSVGYIAGLNYLTDFQSSGEWSIMLALGTDICTTESMQTYTDGDMSSSGGVETWNGWKLTIIFSLTASVYDTAGQYFEEIVGNSRTIDVSYDSVFIFEGGFN